MANITSPRTSPKPFRRAGYLRRALYRFRQLPYSVTIGGTLVLLVATAAVGYYGYTRYQKREANKAVGALWQKFADSTKAGDEPAMKAALEELVAANPDDRIASQRLRAMETGEADPSDAEMAHLTYQKHLRAVPTRWPEAEREARKRLEHDSKDWLARCVVAQAALLKQDEARAVRELDLLPDPSRSDVNVQPGGLLFAFTLFAETHRDATPLRQFVASRVVDRVRSPDSRSWPLSLRLALIECYIRGYDPAADGKQMEGLNRGISALSDLAESCLQEAEAAADAPALLRLGKLSNQLGAAFGMLLKDGTIGDEQYAALVADLELRSARIWRAAIAAQPKMAEGYHGLAVSELRAKHPEQALATVAEGLKQCGDQSDLLAFYSQLLRANNNAAASVRVMAKAALDDPKNLRLWLQLAETARAVGDIPLAAEAVGNATKIAPDDPFVVRAGAWLALVNGNPIQAVFLLEKFDKAAIARDAVLARWYVVAMLDGRLTAKLPEFLRFVEEVAIQSNQPPVLGAALKATNEARHFDAEVARSVILLVDRLLERWPENTDLLTAQAMAHYRLAESGDPLWELAATKNAVRALERLRVKVPDNAEIAAAIAWAKLKGERNANQALISAGVLVDSHKNDLPMSGMQMQVLGAVYYANNRYAEAVAILEKARAAGVAPPAVLIPLSLAYHRINKGDDALRIFRMAQAQKRTPQEQTDYIEAVSILKPPSNP